MEEDIKTVQNFLDDFKDEETGEYIEWHRYIELKECQAIENTLHRLEQLEKENEELKKITQMYDAFGNDYMGNDVKMIIADREYFHNGIFNESFIPKSVIREKIEELEKEIDDLVQNSDVYENNVAKYNDLKLKIEVLEELLGEEE